MDGHNSISTWISNILGGGLVLTTILGLVPAAAAFVAFIWYSIQIYESETVRRWTAARRFRKLARLKARVLMLEAQSKPALPGPETGGAAQID